MPLSIQFRICSGADVLSIWIHANGQLEKLVELCGHTIPPPIMSNSHRLTLELNSITSANFARGFHATYAFVQGKVKMIEKSSTLSPPEGEIHERFVALLLSLSFLISSQLPDFGIKTGRQLEDYPCGFVYNSSERLEGSFWSPNYPGSYPRDTECHYFFYGLVNFERVLLTFTQFHLSGSKP